VQRCAWSGHAPVSVGVGRAAASGAGHKESGAVMRSFGARVRKQRRRGRQIHTRRKQPGGTCPCPPPPTHAGKLKPAVLKGGVRQERQPLQPSAAPPAKKKKAFQTHPDEDNLVRCA